MAQSRVSRKQNVSFEQQLANRGPFEVHNNASFDSVDDVFNFSRDSTSSSSYAVDSILKHNENQNEFSVELGRSQHRLIQLERELSACKGELLVWRNRCCLAEDALQNKVRDHERLVHEVGSLKREIKTMRKQTEAQNLLMHSLSNKIEVMSYLALALSTVSICLVISGMHR
eukprot:g2027.t1